MILKIFLITAITVFSAAEAGFDEVAQNWELDGNWLTQTEDDC